MGQSPPPWQTACWPAALTLVALIPLALARSIHVAWTIRASSTK